MSKINHQLQHQPSINHKKHVKLQLKSNHAKTRLNELFTKSYMHQVRARAVSHKNLRHEDTKGKLE